MEGGEGQKLQELLQSTHIRELLPAREIVSAKGSATVAEALELLTKHNVLSMPVWDSTKQQYGGMVDMEDIVSLFLSTLNSESSPQVAEWKFAHVPIGSVINFSHSDVFLPMEGETSIWHLIEQFTRGIHRIAVLDQHGKVVNIVSQSSVVKFLNKHMDKLGAAGLKTLRQINVIEGPLATISKDTKALAALSSLHKEGRVADALALVDGEGKFCGALSDSDLRGLGYEMFARLQLPVSEFVAMQSQRLPLAKYCCSDDTTLAAAIKRMAKHGLHRLWIVDESQKPLGVVTLLDIMKALMLVSHRSFHDWQKKVGAHPPPSAE